MYGYNLFNTTASVHSWYRCYSCQYILLFTINFRVIQSVYKKQLLVEGFENFVIDYKFI